MDLHPMTVSRRRSWFIVPVLAAAFALPLAPRPATAQLFQLMAPSQAKLLAKLLPTVVNIHSVVGTTPPATPGNAAEPSATDGPAASTEPSAAAAPARPNALDGSGFVIDPSGLIITNNHVVAGAFEITVMFSDGTRLPAHLVGAASAVDVAVIKVDTQRKLSVVRWGNSDKVQVGDPVFAIGNPLGVGLSVSSGIVSALNRDIMDTPYDNFIQTDAPINHGNSGGPLFNRDGDVIGMDTAIISPTTGSVGLGFAIPSNDAQFIASRLIQFHWIRPGWLGVKVEGITSEMAQALGLPDAKGSIVAYVRPDGPGAAAGIKVGDILRRYDGHAPRDDRDLLRMIGQTAAGQTVPINLLRDNQPLTVQATIQEWPRAEWDSRYPTPSVAAQPLSIPHNLGLSLSELTDDLRARYRLQMHQPGVLIAGVSAGTDAAARGLTPGDVLLRVQGSEVSSPQDVQAALDAARAQHKEFVMALVLPRLQDTPGPKWLALQVGPS
jgi:serine protease Do